MRKAARTAVTDATPPLLIQGGLGVAVSTVASPAPWP
jgi:hypothetical protein